VQGYGSWWLPIVVLLVELVAGLGCFWLARRRIAAVKSAEEWFAGLRQTIVADTLTWVGGTDRFWEAGLLYVNRVDPAIADRFFAVSSSVDPARRCRSPQGTSSLSPAASGDCDATFGELRWNWGKGRRDCQARSLVSVIALAVGIRGLGHRYRHAERPEDLPARRDHLGRAHDGSDPDHDALDISGCHPAIGGESGIREV
jgi:hypothetical protein